MSDWIMCGLPWKYTKEYKVPYYKYPNLDKQIRKKFGKTPEEKMNEIYGKKGSFGEYGSGDHPIFLAKEKLQERIENKLKKLNLSDDDFDIELNKRMRASKDPLIKSFFEYKDFKNMVDEWESNNPKVQEIEKKNIQAYEDRINFLRDKSFCGKELNKPGTLIEIDDDGEIKLLLIGDINCSGGKSGDEYNSFNDDAIVLRYRKIDYIY